MPFQAEAFHHLVLQLIANIPKQYLNKKGHDGMIFPVSCFYFPYLQVHLVEDLEKVPNRCNYTKNPQIFFLYVFALGKRGNEGDRDKAYNITTEAVEAMSDKEYRQTDPDLVGKYY